MDLFRIVLIIAVGVPIVRAAAGQSADLQWNDRFVGKPMYLRGFWAGDKLKFDGAGKLLGDPKFWPVTLSGVDVTSATVKDGLLVIHGARVALIAKGDGSKGLERRAIKPDGLKKSHSGGELQLTIEPDPTGSFERALTTIFADGLTELSRSVPFYWKCYAASYFLPGKVTGSQDREVTLCAARMDALAMAGAELSYDIGPGISPPKMKVQVPLQYTAVGRQLGISGTAIVHLRIGIDGIPVGLQVVRALGAGLDEQALDAASHYRFSPATRGGVAVPVNANIEDRFVLNPP